MKHALAVFSYWHAFPDDTPVGQMSGRVGTSLLSALGLPELSFHTVKELEDAAVALVQSPGRLATLRRRQEDKKINVKRGLKKTLFVVWRGGLDSGKLAKLRINSENDDNYKLQ